jgi:hypothetical protein
VVEGAGGLVGSGGLVGAEAQPAPQSSWPASPATAVAA